MTPESLLVSRLTIARSSIIPRPPSAVDLRPQPAGRVGRVPAAYLTRLRLEGGVLAVAGIASSALLLGRLEQARRDPLSTVGQLFALGVALRVRAPRAVDGWMGAAERVEASQVTGEPTPLWQVPVPVVLGGLTFKGLEAIGGPLRPLTRRAGWDAALRVTLGSALVGAVQALWLSPRVAADEARRQRTYYRLPGSRLGATRLGYAPRSSP